MRGCRLMIPVSAWGVMVRFTLRSIRDHSRLSRHLTTTVTKQQTHGCKAIPPEDHHTEVSISPDGVLPFVPALADGHTDTEISSTQVAEDRHPHLPLAGGCSRSIFPVHITAPLEG